MSALVRPFNFRLGRAWDEHVLYQIQNAIFDRSWQWFFPFFFALRGVSFDFGMLLHIYVYQAVLRESPSLRLP